MEFFQRPLQGLEYLAMDAIQGPDGYTWFAGSNGLHRYDGNELLKVIPDQNRKLPTEVIHRLLTNDRELWLATLQGLARLDLNSYKLQLFQHHADKPSSLSDNRIRRISSGRNGNIWVSTQVGLDLFKRQSESFKHYSLPPLKTPDQLGQGFRRVAEDANGNVWAASYWQGLQILRAGETHFLPFSEFTPSLSPQTQTAVQNDSVKDILASRQNTILVLAGNSLLEFDHQQQLINNIRLKHPQKESAQNSNTQSMLEDSEGNIWIRHGSLDLIRVDKNRTSVAYQNITSNKNGLYSSHSDSFYIDNYNTIGLVYGSKLPIYWNPINQVLQKINIQDPKHLNKKLIIKAIHRSHSDSYWLMAEDAVVNFDPKTNISHFFYRSNKGRLAQLNGLIEDKNKRLWVSSEEGLYLLDPVSGQLNLVHTGRVLAMSYNQGNQLWYKDENSLFSMDILSHQLTEFSIPDVNAIALSDIALSENLGVWVASKDALYYLSPQSKKFGKINFNNKIFNAGLSKIAFVDDELWISGRGLSKVTISQNHNKTTAASFEFIASFNQETLSDLVQSENGIWFKSVTGEKIFRYNANNQKISMFDKNNGFPKQAISSNLLLNEEGDLLAATGNTLLILPDAAARLNPLDHELKITSARIIGPKAKNILIFSGLEKITYAYDDYLITVNFSDNSQLSGLEVKAEYRLLGYNDNWQAAHSNSITYTALKSGQYQLEVRRANAPEKVSRAEILVKPAPWASPWSYFIYLLISAQIIGFIIFQLWKLQQREKEQENKMRLYAKGFECAHECFCVINEKGDLIAYNNSFIAMLDDANTASLNTIFDIKSTNRLLEDDSKAWDDIRRDGIWKGETWVMTTSGENIPVDCTANQVEQNSSDGKIYMFAFTDRRERIENEKQLLRLANYDSLTDLPNRNLFNERIRHAVVNAKRNGSRNFGLMFIDLDRFKAINDSLSHHHGDMMLMEFAKRSQLTLRESDTVARLGGDEFVILVESLSQVEDMTLVAKKLFMQFKHPLILDNESLYISLSVGISVFPDDGDNADELIKNADAAMYSSKKKGGNCYSFYTERLNHQSLDMLKLESDIRTALLKDQFVVHYQPKISMSTSNTIGLEALIRWEKPGEGMIAPGLFIESAERTGLIIQIGLTVIKKVCAQLQSWHEQDIALAVAVNVSVKQLLEMNFVEQIENVINQYSFDRRLLEFEITESMVMTDMSTTIFVIATLQQLGHRISVDDFGTGYSSLAYLTQLPIDTLKIDRSFIKDMLIDKDQENIVKTIIQLGKNLNLTLVAEGVEDLDTHHRLAELGCDQGQGYYYQKPCSAEELFNHSEATILSRVKE